MNPRKCRLVERVIHPQSDPKLNVQLQNIFSSNSIHVLYNIQLDMYILR